LSDDSRFVGEESRRASGRTAISFCESRWNREHRRFVGGDFAILSGRPRPNASHRRRDARRTRAVAHECVFSSVRSATGVEKSSSSSDSVGAGGSRRAFTDSPVESHREQSASTGVHVGSPGEKARPTTSLSRLTANKARPATFRSRLLRTKRVYRPSQALSLDEQPVRSPPVVVARAPSASPTEQSASTLEQCASSPHQDARATARRTGTRRRRRSCSPPPCEARRRSCPRPSRAARGAARRRRRRCS
jgi:hypothetical protein